LKKKSFFGWLFSAWVVQAAASDAVLAVRHRIARKALLQSLLDYCTANATATAAVAAPAANEEVAVGADGATLSPLEAAAQLPGGRASDDDALERRAWVDHPACRGTDSEVGRGGAQARGL
jgi:hypothetical protein